MFYVYVYIDPRNNQPFYVGKGKGRRYKQHLQNSKSDLYYKETNKLKINKIRKILKLGLEPLIEIHQTECEESSFRLEMDLIKKYGRIDNKTGILTNLTDGGEGQSGWKPDDAYREKMSECAKGEKNGMAGKKHSEEAKDKMRKKAIGRNIPIEIREKWSRERSGEKNAFYGKKHSKESLEKISKNRKGKCLGELNKSAKAFIFISPKNEKYEIFGTFDKFCDENNLSIGKMRRFVNKGKIPECKPYIKNQTVFSKNCIGWEVIIKNI